MSPVWKKLNHGVISSSNVHELDEFLDFSRFLNAWHIDSIERAKRLILIEDEKHSKDEFTSMELYRFFFSREGFRDFKTVLQGLHAMLSDFISENPAVTCHLHRAQTDCCENFFGDVRQLAGGASRFDAQQALNSSRRAQISKLCDHTDTNIGTTTATKRKEKRRNVNAASYEDEDASNIRRVRPRGTKIYVDFRAFKARKAVQKKLDEGRDKFTFTGNNDYYDADTVTGTIDDVGVEEMNDEVDPEE